MKILLIQDEIFLPSFGGGTKANRCLLEGLARRGHQCVALTRALTRSSEGPNSPKQFFDEMKARGAVVSEIEPDLFSYLHNGVQVEALNHADSGDRRDCLVRRIQATSPDWVLVTDDKRRFMLEAAMRAAPNRVILLLQTIVQLPFGPLSIDPTPEYSRLVKSARALFVISNFMKQYVHDFGGLDAHLLPIPVYGEGPFPDLARFNRGFVTMINPCELKGVSLFFELARTFPDTRFAAVPTWGADTKMIARLRNLPNVQLLDPVDDIEEILRQTRILLVPSLWPETFGYVVPEAMLRGIPVLASDVGGLPEAKLGVDYLLPVVPGEFCETGFVSPPQDVSPWATALNELLSDEGSYDRCSRHSRQAAHDFVSSVSVAPFEALMTRLMNSESEIQIHSEFKRYIDEQPYSVILDGLRLTIDKDVFPPDMGKCSQNLARIANGYCANTALDMGCGSGFLALSLKRGGAREVWASDVHEPAVRCTRANAEQNDLVQSIHVVQSDLFNNIPATLKFDLIVFNQPFGPGQGETVCGCGPDGGYEITKRFLKQAATRLNSDGVVLMAFSDREPAGNSPDRVARELGFRVSTLLHAFYGEANNYIYEIRPTRC